jgi:hypothetical protein
MNEMAEADREALIEGITALVRMTLVDAWDEASPIDINPDAGWAPCPVGEETSCR